MRLMCLSFSSKRTGRRYRRRRRSPWTRRTVGTHVMKIAQRALALAAAACWRSSQRSRRGLHANHRRMALVGGRNRCRWGQKRSGWQIAGGWRRFDRFQIRRAVAAAHAIRHARRRKRANLETLSRPNGEPPQGAVGIALYSPATAAGFGRIDTIPADRERVARARVRAFDTGHGSRDEPLRRMGGDPRGCRRARRASRPRLEVIRSSGPLDGLSRAEALLIDSASVFRNRPVQSATLRALVGRLGRRVPSTRSCCSRIRHGRCPRRAVDQQPPQGWSAARLRASRRRHAGRDGPESSSRSRAAAAAERRSRGLLL